MLAGGQTLGPMLNLRLAQPALLVDITRIPELAAVARGCRLPSPSAPRSRTRPSRTAASPDPTGGFLARVARGIAYRAVRNRGTIGGSLAHADPAADWLSCLTALGADVEIAGAGGTRRVGVAGFVRGAMETELAGDELLVAVRIPKFSRGGALRLPQDLPQDRRVRRRHRRRRARSGAAADAARGQHRRRRRRSSSTPGICISTAGNCQARPTLQQRLVQAGLAGDAYDLKLHAVAVRRAIAQALAP